VLLVSGGTSSACTTMCADTGGIGCADEVLAGGDETGATRWHLRLHTLTWVFGLPGNPVSSMVCFEEFVGPALRCSMDIPDFITVR